MGEARDLVAKTLLKLGYEPVWQEVFEEYGAGVFLLVVGLL